MVLTTLVVPMRLRRDPLHSPLHRTCRPRGRCRKMMRHDTPAGLFARAGRSHGHRGHFPLTPLVEDLLGMWTDVAGIPLCRPKTPRKPDWKETLNCEGFSPKEVSLEICDGKICVSCSHEENDGKGNVDIRQLKKTVGVPEDVDLEKLKVSFSRRAMLVITAPRKPAVGEQNADVKAKAVEDMDLEWQREDDECSCNGCLEEDKGETSDSSPEDMDIQKVVSIDLTGDEAEEQAPEAEMPVQPESNQPEKDVQIVEENSETEMSKAPGDKSQEIPARTQKPEQAADSDTNLTHPETTRDLLNQREGEQTPQKETTVVEAENRLFEIHVDMKNFNPDSIEVKLNGNTLTISGKQEEKDKATGKVVSSRALYRRFLIPNYVNCDLLASSLDPEGLMTISAPYKSEEDLAEKVIPISVN